MWDSSSPQHHVVGLVATLVSFHSDAVTGFVPVEDALARSDGGFLRVCCFDVGDHGLFAVDEAAVGLVNRSMVGRNVVPRKTLVYLCPGERLVINVVGFDRAASLSEQVRIGRAGVNRAGNGEEVAAGFLFEFAPVLEGGSCETFIPNASREERNVLLRLW